ncbi:hypothetical protein BDW02DRAFT_587583 [Decorospora gaudefroyi]|uniref:DUF3112 domain-containing protein n=1 Tax=Decorospora gaudefroyi TaxID=184978 RepID=A0A6A5KKQ1_9PLEO|nr:hypothetical protein BDW02DRAFT_587583 [Decorospora gaudefroyi]
MSSQPGTQGPPSGASGQEGPPYAPRNAGLGGTPTIVPDVPLAVVFLVLYLIFGVIHIKIFKSNKNRGHKFIFNGAILGLCKVRIITMSLRIAWANYPRNVGLAIAANVFVYAGTIILYMVDWFFVQRIVRAQHARLGWSTPYRIFHRAGLVLLVLTLIMLIISQIWQFFTLDQRKLNIFHDLFLVAQTYFTVFCFAPTILIGISLLIPRTEVEKFGAGRLRYNIIILLISVCILSIGQVFRCVLAYVPATPIVDIRDGTVSMPWYLSKAAFYCFNFVTEIIVIVLFAVIRVDLRFHVPNGSRKSGDYSRSRVDLHNQSEKNLNAPAPGPMIHQNNSNQTLHRYQSSVFEDTQTLADSLRYPSSTLEVDEKTGNWKVKRLSVESSRSSRHTTISFAGSSRTTLHDRTTLVDDDAPPVPHLPAEWPLPDAAPPRGSTSVLEHTNPPSRRGTPQQRTFELQGHRLNDIDVGNAVTDALARLETNSERHKLKSPTPPPNYHSKLAVQTYKPTLPGKNDNRPSSRQPRRRSTFPPKETSRSTANSTNSDAAKTPVIEEAPELPSQNPTALTSEPMRRSEPATSPSHEIISLLNHMSGDQRRVLNTSQQRDRASSVATSQNGPNAGGLGHVDNNISEQAQAPASGPVTTQTSPSSSSKYSSENDRSTTSSEAREAALAQEEFRRFSSEAPPSFGSMQR